MDFRILMRDWEDLWMLWKVWKKFRILVEHWEKIGKSREDGGQLSIRVEGRVKGDELLSFSYKPCECFCLPERGPSAEVQVMEDPPADSWDWTISPLSTRLCDFSKLRVMVALQKANGSWAFTAALASALGLSEADVEGRRPSEVSGLGAGVRHYHELNLPVLQVSSLS